ncbi:GGDEF domain-containing protein [Pseudothauera rhizosphaerae]|uniref:GGDEF domain-containing protein n=2 Tax=Pseudothauera rhizosphaerae TaxID=2565932 RepID=A0A4S4AZ29_9RHOO|nr:GGDEF domain-containing protein [Pseudothauera rhizosphaerae]
MHSYSLPTSPAGRWLAAPSRETPPEIRAALVGTLFGTLPIFFGGVFNTIAVAAVLAYRHPTLPFLLWLVLEIAVGVARLAAFLVSRRRAAQGRATPTDLYLMLAPLWGSAVGYGGFISATSGDWVAATLAFLSAAAMVGGICFRNFAAPRLVVVMIVCSLGPCSAGALLSGEPVFLLVLLQFPFYLFSMNVAARRLNAMLISTMKAEREYSHRARHDPLTGLLNREGLFQALEGLGAAPTGADMKLLYLDLDGFKAVNDAHGHEIGDMLLMQVAARLRALAGPRALVARMGGDEFVVIDEIADDDPAQEHLAEAIAGSIRSPFLLPQGATVTVGASVGVAKVSRDGTDIDAALRQADTAMYGVKRTRGRSRASQ